MIEYIIKIWSFLLTAHLRVVANFYERCARTSLVFLAGVIPALERVKPAHQESSLGLMEVTT